MKVQENFGSSRWHRHHFQFIFEGENEEVKDSDEDIGSQIPCGFEKNGRSKRSGLCQFQKDSNENSVSEISFRKGLSSACPSGCDCMDHNICKWSRESIAAIVIDRG